MSTSALNKKMAQPNAGRRRALPSDAVPYLAAQMLLRILTGQVLDLLC
jgi:hypothetical protein